MNVEIEIIGLEKALAKCKPALLATPLHDLFFRSTTAVQNRARVNAPVDTGRLRSSIGIELDDAEVPLWGKVGTNVAYAKAMEFGTGLLSEAPDSRHARHIPPGDALDVWARRHGFESGWEVAKIIGRRGGLRPRRYLRNALKESLGDIRGFVERAGREIADAWGK